MDFRITLIAIPLAASTLGGLDALLSSVQMPAGVPVAVTTIGKAGAVNAACLAARILAIENPTIRTKLEAFRQNNSKLPPGSPTAEKK